jgi:hypothetical protein
VTQAQEPKLIVFQGLTPNIGTTVVSFSASYMLAERLGAPVGYVCLNLKSSRIHHYCGFPPHSSLDRIRGELRADTLTVRSLLDSCARIGRRPNLAVLCGNRLREQAEYYHPEDIDRLLRLCRDAFSVTVAEVNAYWDNAATLCAMRQADMRVIVATDQPGSFQEDFSAWTARLFPALELAPERSGVFVAQRREDSDVRLADIGRATGMDILGCLERDGRIERMLEQGRLPELAEQFAPLRASISSLLDKLGFPAGLADREPVRKSSRNPFRWRPLMAGRR